jgi:hypothetical protein
MRHGRPQLPPTLPWADLLTAARSDLPTAARVLALRHVLNDGPTARATPTRFQWAWAAYAVWPKDEPGVPGVYEWLAAAPTPETPLWWRHNRRL